jgi:uncharacterized protein (TIGR03435 family)
MLRPVLEDRFKLKYHREKKQMPVYLFAEATGGIQFRETLRGSCTPIDPSVGPPPPGPAKKGEPAPAPACGRILNQILPGDGVRVTAKGITMAQLAGDLGPYLDLPVVEQTGSSKLFDVDLSFAKSDVVVSDTSRRSPGSRVGDEPSSPTIFAALKKAGLSATRGQGAVEVLVIDQLERLAEN